MASLLPLLWVTLTASFQSVEAQQWRCYFGNVLGAQKILTFRLLPGWRGRGLVIRVYDRYARCALWRAGTVGQAHVNFLSGTYSFTAFKLKSWLVCLKCANQIGFTLHGGEKAEGEACAHEQMHSKSWRHSNTLGICVFSHLDCAVSDLCDILCKGGAEKLHKLVLTMEPHIVPLTRLYLLLLCASVLPLPGKYTRLHGKQWVTYRKMTVHYEFKGY